MSIEREGSARKQELLRATLEYAVMHSLSDLSLRPLAKAIGIQSTCAAVLVRLQERPDP